MDITGILFAALCLGGLGLVFGLGLGIAAKKFAIEVDPMVPIVRELLPGANCGGCGFAGCDAFANAVVRGDAAPNGCPVNNDENAGKIAAALGREMVPTEKMVSYVKCYGTCENAAEKYTYYGIADCQSAHQLQGGGSKGCAYGCLGLGSCVKVCQFGALSVVDGVAVVDEKLCTACGMCIGACPKNLLEMVPAKSVTRVQCASKDKGKQTKDLCKVGCIACNLCVKACEYDAIHVVDNLAKIDYEKCTNCGACVAKCPTKAIHSY